MYEANQGILSIYASGRCSGIVLDIGDGVCQTVGIYEGHCTFHSVRRQNLSGQDITQYLAELLKSKGYSFETSIEKDIVRDIKEKQSYIALNYDEEIDKWESNLGTKSIDIDQKYELPDGSVINLNIERFKCGELLFNPKMGGIDAQGIHELYAESIFAHDIDVRRDYFANLIICGGTTLMDGFAERLKVEMEQIFKSKYKSISHRVKIVAPPERKYSTWIGGSIVASLSTFQESWITAQEYDEEGARVVRSRFDSTGI